MDYNPEGDPELDTFKNDLNSSLSTAKQDLEIQLQKISQMDIDGTFSAFNGYSFTSALGHEIVVDDNEIQELKEMRKTFQGDTEGVLRDYFGTKLIKLAFQEYKLDKTSQNNFNDLITNYLHGYQEFTVSSVDADSTSDEISIIFSTK